MAISPCLAQVMPDGMTHGRYALYYYHDRIDIDKDYLDNAYQIYRIKHILQHSTRIDSITIYAYASPEGSLSRNIWLAEQRAIAARDFILDNLPHGSVLDPADIHLRPMGENWDGLLAELEANYHLRNRDRVMRIMHADIPTETKKWRLKRLDNGYTYNWIIRNHMPHLRMATWILVHVPPQEMSIDYEPVDEIRLPAKLQPIAVPAPADKVERRTIFAVKSNLLYDALTLLNYSIEVPVTRNISALFYHQFPWYRWGEGNNKYCIRFLSVGGEARWWFRTMRSTDGSGVRDWFEGSFLGLYAESGKWDFERGRKYCRQGEHWSFGLSYGYAMPLGKHLNLEFSVSVGYASIAYRKFIPSENYEILWRDPKNHGRWNYIGPTKAQVSLVLPITVKKKKGGKQ